MQKLPTLFKLDSLGNIREWSISVSNNPVGYTVTHGMVGGSLQTNTTEIREGKNEGKAHATNPYQQATAEAISLWTKQKDRKGYSEIVPTQKELRPMLAKTYNEPDDFDKLKDGKHIEFPCYGQPKLDGLCCLAQKVGDKIRFMSRQGKEFTTLGHIETSLLRHGMANWEIYHGELYSHELTFQEIVSAVKRDETNKLSEKIQFWIYDLVREDWHYEDRITWLKEQKLEKYDNLKVVYTFNIRSHEDVVKEHLKWTNKGFEGIMLRNRKGLYEIDKRTKNLQKVKRFFDQEFPIIGAEPCKGKMEGMCSLTLKTEEGAIFNCLMEGDEMSRRQVYQDFKDGKLAGKSLNVRFFSWTDTNPKVPRFPVGLELR